MGEPAEGPFMVASLRKGVSVSMEEDLLQERRLYHEKPGNCF